MSFETVERLKRDFTDKWVTVDAGTPELKRFVGLSGLIKTINMNGRALVQFDNPVDISWYDIDLSYLKVIAAPLPKKTAEKHAEPAAKKPTAAAPAATAPAAATATPAAAGGAKKSPIELIREAAAAKAAAAAGGAAAPTPAPAGDKPLSKIELARQQGAAAKAKAAGAAPAPVAEPVAAAEPAPPPAAAPAAPVSMVGEDGKPLSKIELARRQGAAKNK